MHTSAKWPEFTYSLGVPERVYWNVQGTTSRFRQRFHEHRYQLASQYGTVLMGWLICPSENRRSL